MSETLIRLTELWCEITEYLKTDTKGTLLNNVKLNSSSYHEDNIVYFSSNSVKHF